MTSDDNAPTRFRLTDADLAAYLRGDFGPPSTEAVDIIQSELEHAIRSQEDSDDH